MPVSPPRAPRKRRRAYHHGDLRRALVDASAILVDEKGEGAFTLREAARRVGVSHAAAYRHFADKSAVLEAISAEGYRELGVRLREAIARIPASRADLRLLRIACAYVVFAIEREPRLRVMTRPRAEEKRSPELEAAIDDALGVLVGVATDGVRTGVLRDEPPIDHAMRVYLFAYGYASLFLRGRLRVRPDKVESYFKHLLSPIIAAVKKA
jgi:AcrR family transcriptional regulator